MGNIVLAKVYQKSDKQIKKHQNILYLFILTKMDLSLLIFIIYCIKMIS